MPWVRLDDQFHNHPKLAMLGQLQLPCVGLHVMAMCWSSQYITDGFLPEAQPAKLAGDLIHLLPQGRVDPLIGALLDVGLWEEVDGGYRIHDYLNYQPSKAQVEADRAQKAAAGQAGGQATAKARARRVAIAGAKAPATSPAQAKSK